MASYLLTVMAYQSDLWTVNQPSINRARRDKLKACALIIYVKFKIAKAKIGVNVPPVKEEELRHFSAQAVKGQADGRTIRRHYFCSCNR